MEEIPERSMFLVTEKVKELIAIEQEIKLKEEELKKKVTERDYLKRNEIPDAMFSFGLQKFTLENGMEVNLQKRYHASIPEANGDAAYSWMINNGHGDLIKKKLVIDYDDESDEFLEVVTLATEYGYSLDLKKSIHPQTLKAFVKEQVEKGVEIPSDTISVYEYTETVIKRK